MIAGCCSLYGCDLGLLDTRKFVEFGSIDVSSHSLAWLQSLESRCGNIRPLGVDIDSVELELLAL